MSERVPEVLATMGRHLAVRGLRSLGGVLETAAHA